MSYRIYRYLPAILPAVLLAAAVPAWAGVQPIKPPAVANPLQIRIADAQQGQEIFQSHCSVCHTVKAGAPNKFGPNLHGLFGRRAGSLPGYNYSSAMRAAGAAGLVWSAVTLDPYIKNPHEAVPGDKMPFAGLPNEAQRQDVIAYLKQATQ